MGLSDAVAQWGTKWEVDIDNLAVDRQTANDNITTLGGYFERVRESPQTEALQTYLDNNPDCEGELYYYEPAMDFCGNMNNNITISNVNKDFFVNDPVGQELEGHFAIIDYLEEFEEEEQEQALATPPDVLEPPEQIPNW